MREKRYGVFTWLVFAALIFVPFFIAFFMLFAPAFDYLMDNPNASPEALNEYIYGLEAMSKIPTVLFVSTTIFYGVQGLIFFFTIKRCRETQIKLPTHFIIAFTIATCFFIVYGLALI